MMEATSPEAGRGGGGKFNDCVLFLLFCSQNLFLPKYFMFSALFKSVVLMF